MVTIGFMAYEDPHLGVDEEQFRLAIKLEGIFMPHFRKRRDEAHQRQAGSASGKDSLRFVHYTSAEAALSIVAKKRIWMRNTTCMSDYREVQHGFDILNNFFTKEANLGAFINALDICTPGAAKQAIDLFNQWWRAIRFNTYITSISEHDEKENLHGRLSMWRAFGGSTARVAVIFDIPWFSVGARSLNLVFSPVAYLTEGEAHAMMNEVIKNIAGDCDFLRSVNRETIVANVFHMLLVGVTCLKHEGFSEEREWRAIYVPEINLSPLMERSTEVIAGVPQIVYKLPLDEKVNPSLADLELSRIFNSIIIGPSTYPWAMYQAFVQALTNAGVPKAEDRVLVSHIPIRA
jgi:hypothetical protein